MKRNCVVHRLNSISYPWVYRYFITFFYYCNYRLQRCNRYYVYYTHVDVSSFIVQTLTVALLNGAYRLSRREGKIRKERLHAKLRTKEGHVQRKSRSARSEGTIMRVCSMAETNEVSNRSERKTVVSSSSRK